MQRMERESEALLATLTDSQAIIKQQASKCLKTGSKFKSQRKRIKSALEKSKEQGKKMNDKLNNIEEKLARVLSEI